ncbi:group II intron reverse transcriptase/maturase [Herbaspirillum sp. GCM10030257]|uniref:group II intron reverse transcriptase/maturase n=1 Tax=Herbaspirillum sp. GCM10030257 TaxID=3273393 RepID=UPI00360BBADD
MTASGNIDVDAAFTRSADWLAIDWRACCCEVKKLQARIAKAVREGRWRKVKALQWLLTHSFSAKALAVRRVTENQGKRTPGVDGVTWSTPVEKSEAIDSLKRSGYQTKPLRRVYIPKSNGKRRGLSIPVKKDLAMQALHKLALEPVAETMADHNSYGFRPGRCTADAIEQVFNVLSHKESAQWVLEGDIKACFDEISHPWMVQNICTDTKVLEQWLKAGFIEKGQLFPTTEGCPQGGIISPTAANMVLDGLEDLLGAFYGSSKIDGYNNRMCRNKVHFVRYADDWVITSTSKELLENEIKPLVREFLAERGLELSEEKTKVTHVSEGFNFLGQNVRKYCYGKSNRKLLIKPAKKNVKAFLEGIRKTIHTLRTATQETVIKVLNPKIIGWANYHRHVVAKDTFAKIDDYLWHCLWHWAKRRHRNKNGHWIYAKYFRKIENRSAVFSCKVVQEDGSVKLVRLQKAADIEIQRHPKIQGAATPFDPSYEQYFEKREATQMATHFGGRRKLLYLWRQQKGRCPICTEKINKETGWHIHHLIRRVDGGSDVVSNLCLLHPACHTQGHSSGFKFVLPVGSEHPA